MKRKYLIPVGRETYGDSEAAPAGEPMAASSLVLGSTGAWYCCPYEAKATPSPQSFGVRVRNLSPSVEEQWGTQRPGTFPSL